MGVFSLSCVFTRSFRDMCVFTLVKAWRHCGGHCLLCGVRAEDSGNIQSIYTDAYVFGFVFDFFHSPFIIKT